MATHEWLKRTRLAQLLTLGDGDDGEGFLARILTAYETIALETLSALREAAPGENPEGARQAAHRLRGASLDVGATHVADLCEQLEDLAWPSLDRAARIDALESALTATIAELRTALGLAARGGQ